MLPGRLKIRNLSVFSRILSEKLKNRIPLAWKTIYRVENLCNFENIWVFANLFWMYLSINSRKPKILYQPFIFEWIVKLSLRH